MSKFIRVAVATDDGKTISAHPARAKYFEIITISDGKITDRVRITKGIHHVLNIEGEKSSLNRRNKHIIPPFPGCTHMIARGIGSNAYHRLLRLDINPILTDIHSIDEALTAFISGSIISHTNRIH